MPNITDRTVRALRAKDKPYEVRDDRLKGFLVRVQPSGQASFIVEVGRGKRITLGRVGVVLPSRARQLAETALGRAAEGGSVDEIRNTVRPRVDAVPTLNTLLTDCYEPWALHHTKRGAEEAARIRALFSEFIKEPHDKITAWRLERWRLNRLNAGRSPHTVARDMASLRSAWRHFRVEHNPFKDLRKERLPDNKRIRFLEPDEERALRAAMDEREAKLRDGRASGNEWRRERGKEQLPEIDGAFADYFKPMVLVSLGTGVRWGELTSLVWADIDLVRRTLYVRAAAAKSGKPRTIPLNYEVLGTLEAWKKQVAAESKALVFAGREGEKLTHVKRSWATVTKAAGLSNLRWHDLRHAFASKLVQAGVDLNIVRELMGHADLQMTLRYSHLRQENLADAVSKISAPPATALRVVK